VFAHSPNSKRLWGMGNFSKFIRPGYTRVSAISDDKEVNVVSFLGKNEANEEELITVLINNSFQEKEIDIQGVGFDEIISYTTDSESDLKESFAHFLPLGQRQVLHFRHTLFAVWCHNHLALERSLLLCQDSLPQRL